MNSGNWKWFLMAMSACWYLSGPSFADDEPKKIETVTEQKADAPPTLNSTETTVQVPRRERPAADQPRERDAAEIQQRLQEFRRKIDELREQGKQEEAAELQRQAESLMRRVQGESNRSQIEAMQRQIEELRKAGQADQAAELEQAVRELVRRQREGQGREDAERGPGRRPDSPPSDRGDLERRLTHLREAAENLDAAGLHELANQLRRQAEEMARSGQGPEGRAPAGEPRRPGPDGRGPGPDGRRGEGDVREPRWEFRDGPQGRNPEGRNPEGRNPEGRNPEGRNPEGRNPEGRGPEARGPGPEGRDEIRELRNNVMSLSERMTRLEQLLQQLVSQRKPEKE